MPWVCGGRCVHDPEVMYVWAVIHPNPGATTKLATLAFAIPNPLTEAVRKGLCRSAIIKFNHGLHFVLIIKMAEIWPRDSDVMCMKLRAGAGSEEVVTSPLEFAWYHFFNLARVPADHEIAPQ